MSKKYYGKTEVVESYKKELTRLRRQIKSMQNRGYVIDESIIPKTPKKITPSSVKNLKKITSKSLYEKSLYYNEDAQELISGKVARGYERRISAQKANITKEYEAIENYYSDLLEDLNPALEPLQTLQDLEQQELDTLNERDNESEEDYSWYDEPEPPTKDDADDFRPGSIDIIELVREKLANIPFIFYTRDGVLNLEEYYLEILNIFDEKVASYSGKDYDRCADYLNSIMGELDSAIADLFEGPSDSPKINSCYTKLYKIVKGMPLSKDEEIYLGELSDSTDEWGEEY